MKRKDKVKIIVYIMLIIFLSIIFILAKRTEKLEYNYAKTKLESIRNKSYEEDETINISTLKEKINKDVDSNIELLNPDTIKFPVLTKVDDYKFEVEENGNIKDVVEENSEVENITNEENTTDNNLENNINVVENNITETNDIEGNNVSGENMDNPTDITIKYIAETTEYKGVNVSITEAGEITLNGKSTDKLFIKVTNGIFCTNDGNENIALAKTEPVILKKGENINVEVKELSGNCDMTNDNHQFNVVLKYVNGEIAANCQTKSNIFTSNLKLEEDVSMIYLYCTKDVAFKDYQIKITIEKAG